MAEYTINVNGKKGFKISAEGKELSSGTINGKTYNIDLKMVRTNQFHILRNNKSYQADLVSLDVDAKKLVIAVDGEQFNLEIEDRYDALLHSMGLDVLADSRVTEIKAPMPGKVLDIAVKANQQVSEGDTLLVLEAMKMENVIKSPVAAVVGKVSIKKGQIVDKNEILIHFS